MELHQWMSPGSVNEALFKHYKGNTEVVRELSRESSRSKSTVLFLFWCVFLVTLANFFLSIIGKMTFITVINSGSLLIFSVVAAISPREHPNNLGLNASRAREYVLHLYNELGFHDFEIHSYEQIVSLVHENLTLAARAIGNTDNPIDEEVLDEDFDRKYQIYSRFDFVHSREYYFK